MKDGRHSGKRVVRLGMALLHEFVGWRRGDSLAVVLGVFTRR